MDTITMLRISAILLLVAAGIVAIVGAIGDRGSAARTDPARVTIVDGAGHVVGPAVAPSPTTLARAATPVPVPVIEEAPDSLKALHAAVQAGRSPDRAADEGRIRNLFAGRQVFAGQQVDVTCAPTRCEVRGSATGDEVATRLAFESDAMLDAVAASGYSVGTSIVSGRERGSEFVVYLESGTPT